MNEEQDEIKRWTARRKAAVVMDIIKGKTTATEVARSHDLTVGEVELWMDDFVSMGTEALRSHPRCSAPLQVGQPFVLFRLLRCIVFGGIGLVSYS